VKTHILIVALVVAGIAAALWLWRADGAPPAAPAPVAALPAPAPIEPAASSGARIELPPPASAGEGLRVLVQDRSRRPVAGAEISVIGADTGLAFPPTGSDGWTRAPRLPNGNIWLKARGGNLTGTASWLWSPTMGSDVTIWVNPDREVEVAVTDPSGAPQSGVQVSLFAASETDWRFSRLQAATDELGIARIHVDGDEWLAANEKVRAVALLASKPVAAEPAAWSESGPTRIGIAVERQAPPTGPELRVRFVDAQGLPCEVRGTLDWSRIESRGTFTLEGPAGEMAVAGTGAKVTPLLDGDHVRLHLQEEGRLESQLEVTLPAGARAQEVMLPRGPAAPRIEVPLVDRHQKPVTEGDFVVTVLMANGGYERESTLRPDGAGLLTVTLAEVGEGTIEIASMRDAAVFHWPEPKRLERPYRTTLGKPSPPNPSIAVLPLPRCEAGERRRLPPVTVPEVAPRIVGVVVDAGGRPAPAVQIWMTTVAAPEPEPFAAFATTTDAQGRFAIRATSLPHEVFVCGRRPLGFCAPVRVRPSAEPVTLHLQPTGAIALDLRQPERAPLPEAVAALLRLSVSLRVEDDALGGGWWAFYRERQPFFEGKWRERWSALGFPGQGKSRSNELVFRDLVPGVYEVQATVGINRVLDCPGVRVAAGETARPPQAQGVALGSGIEAAPVRVRDDEGRPVAKAHVQVLLPEWKPYLQWPEMRDTDANGEAWFVVPRGAVADVDVTAERRAPVSLQGATLPLDVAIGAGTSLDFEITGHAQAAKDSRWLVVVCKKFTDAPPQSPVVHVGETEMFGHPQANLDAGGRCTIPNLPPGTWRLWLGAVPPIEPGRHWTYVLLGDRTITARDGPRETIQHAVTAEETATLLGR
jgi:hypothetical protein